MMKGWLCLGVASCFCCFFRGSRVVCSIYVASALVRMAYSGRLLFLSLSVYAWSCNMPCRHANMFFIVIFALAVQVSKRKRKKYIQPLMDFRGYSSGVSESSNGMSIIGNWRLKAELNDMIVSLLDRPSGCRRSCIMFSKWWLLVA